jgi:hypothetical protein
LNSKGRPAVPDHWSGWDLMTRGSRVGGEFEEMVVHSYDRRNFAVHTGLNAILNLQQPHFEAMCAMALKQIGECLFGALKTVCSELRMDLALENFENRMLILDAVASYAFLDKVLQSHGEPVRYSIFKGNPPIVVVRGA